MRWYAFSRPVSISLPLIRTLAFSDGKKVFWALLTIVDCATTTMKYLMVRVLERDKNPPGKL